MANPLTGDFEAVVQVSVRQINGLLATLHQNGANTTAPLRLLHSVRSRIGDPKRPRPDFAGFGEWVLEYQRELPPKPRPPLHDLVVSTAPPGAARRLSDAFADIDLVLDPDPPDLVRGKTDVQISTVRVSVEHGSSSEVTVEAVVRARYFPDPNTTVLPEPVHGTVRATFEVRKTFSPIGTRLFIRPSSQDQKIDFVPSPATGMSPADGARIAAEVRRFLRDGILLLPVDLPPGFPFADFKGVGSPSVSALALPLQLSGAPPPPGGVQSISQSFVGTSGFAFGVSEGFVRGMVDVDAIRESIMQRPIRIRVSVFGFSGTVTYHLRFSSGPTLTFQHGFIEVSGRVEVETGTWWAPNGFVRFRQRFTLVLDPDTQRVSPDMIGVPSIDKSWFIPRSVALNAVRREIRSALRASAPGIRAAFGDAKADLLSAARNFEPSISGTYTGVEVSPAGVVARGDLSSAARIAPIVHVGETDGGSAFTAFETWIPGGQTDRFDWSWIENPHATTPWGGIVRFASEVSRFTLTKPFGIDAIERICLRIHGTRVLPDGRTETAAGGAACEIQEPVISFDAPSWWEAVTVPVWQPGLSEGALLRDGIVAHVSLQSDRPPRRPMQNALVFFPDWDSPVPFEMLVAALQGVRRREAMLSLFVVVPEGAFDVTRREFEARLAGLDRLPHQNRVQFAEDVQGGWARSFDAVSRPAVFVVNARREFAWRSSERLDAGEIAEAIDRHVVPAPTPTFRPLRLLVSVGAAAPDFTFGLDGEDGRALHRLRGRRIVVVFWQSWSRPCLAELRRLDAFAAAERDAPLVFAFHGGPAAPDFDVIRKEHGLTLPLFHDAEHRVSRRFGVRCWPTTVTIDESGRIEHVQFGLETEMPRERSAS